MLRGFTDAIVSKPSQLLHYIHSYSSGSNNIYCIIDILFGILKFQNQYHGLNVKSHQFAKADKIAMAPLISNIHNDQWNILTNDINMFDCQRSRECFSRGQRYNLLYLSGSGRKTICPEDTQ